MQARQLESLIRMAEARARLELAETVTAQHAQVLASTLLLQIHNGQFCAMHSMSETVSAQHAQVSVLV